MIMSIIIAIEPSEDIGIDSTAADVMTMTSNCDDKKKDVEEPLCEKPKNRVKQSVFQKIINIKSNISVEPVVAGLVIPSMLAKLAVQNLNLEKACLVKLNYGREICGPLIERRGNFSDYEREVQKVISSIETWKSIIHTAVPTLLVMFMGAWSDRTGNRKICILLPIFGEFLASLSNIISTVFFYEIPVEVTMFLEVFCPAMTGGWVMMFLGVFSYISDITSEESRTFRVGMVNLCLTAGIPIGTALSGILLKYWGYLGIFMLSGSLYLLTLTYGFMYLKNNTKTGDDDANKSTNKRVIWSDLMTLQKDTISVVTKRRNGNLRLRIIFNLFVVASIYGPDHGERLITYLFVRYRLNWNAVRFSMYSTYSCITHTLAALFSISVFSRRWGFDDSMLCLISVVSKFAGSVYINFVHTDLQMFMVPIVELLNATTFTSLRSMASKLVPSEELGKMNSMFSLVETLAALMFDPTYAALYAATMKNFTGAVFLFSAGMTLPAISVLLCFFIHHRRELRQKNEDSGRNNAVLVNSLVEINNLCN